MSRRFVLPDQYFQSDEPVLVEGIEIRGNEATEEDVFHLYLDEAHHARSARALFAALEKGRERLMRLGVLRSVRMVVDAGSGAGRCRVGVIADELPRKE